MIEVLNESGVRVDERELVAVARHVLATMGVSPLAELAISLKDVAEMERLHVQYMDEPGPTDVMAFPMDELDLLTVHGILHLLGYDHGEPEEHAEMFGLQAELLASFSGRDGVADGAQPEAEHEHPAEGGQPERGADA